VSTPSAVRVLLVEDSDDDAFLLVHHLEQIAGGVEVERVDSADLLQAALSRKPWDIVVSDYRLPRFGGMEALAIVRRFDRDLPFILVSATIGEEAAVEAMRAGATDYVMKGNLARLRPAVQRELREAAMRRDKKSAEARLEHLACYDPATGLANRMLFGRRLALWLEAAGRRGESLAVVLFDIDRYKSLNATLGSRTLDEVLRQVGARLAKCTTDPSHVARVGEDRFALAIPGALGGREVALAVESCLVEVFGPEFRPEGHEVAILARAGVALYPDDGSAPDELLRNAEAALGRARARGETHMFYSEDMTARIAERLGLERRLRGALARGELELHYQPQVTLADMNVCGLEALIRWRSPELGLVAPARFVPLLEETGLILDVGAWVLRQAAQDRRAWAAQGLKPPRVAINISMTQVRQRDFVAMVRDSLGAAEAGIDLEFTESVVMEDVEDCVEKLTALRRLGLRLVIDDFGMGYSSLSYLARLPVHTLKIDRSFVAGMLSEPHIHTLVATILSMARSLRLETIAEGVEVREQLEALEAMGCDQAQGYLLSRPLEHRDATRMLERRAGLHGALPTLDGGLRLAS